ncbi:MAG: hypothetical protein P8010_16340 [Desulfosarcinaceae bacterium]
MPSGLDILAKKYLSGEEVQQLNFISDSSHLCFRRYYRQGLRSHIFEVLATEAVLKETIGEIINGVRWFPRAAPRHMLRIMRTRFHTLEEVLEETNKYALMLKCLGPDLIAKSNEFIVEYHGAGEREIVLCGLQEYVDGATLDPWALFGQAPLEILYRSRFSDAEREDSWLANALASIDDFVKRVRGMIADEGHIPDIAGNGNLILTKAGKIKLVDINNILRIDRYDTILIDDKGYPACDKSMEVLVILEEKILKNKVVSKDPLYSRFLEQDRRKKVEELEAQFFNDMAEISAISRIGAGNRSPRPRSEPT